MLFARGGAKCSNMLWRCSLLGLAPCIPETFVTTLTALLTVEENCSFYVLNPTGATNRVIGANSSANCDVGVAERLPTVRRNALGQAL